MEMKQQLIMQKRVGEKSLERLPTNRNENVVQRIRCHEDKVCDSEQENMVPNKQGSSSQAVALKEKMRPSYMNMTDDSPWVTFVSQPIPEALLPCTAAAVEVVANSMAVEFPSLPKIPTWTSDVIGREGGSGSGPSGMEVTSPDTDAQESLDESRDDVESPRGGDDECRDPAPVDVDGVDACSPVTPLLYLQERDPRGMQKLAPAIPPLLPRRGTESEDGDVRAESPPLQGSTGTGNIPPRRHYDRVASPPLPPRPKIHVHMASPTPSISSENGSRPPLPANASNRTRGATIPTPTPTPTPGIPDYDSSGEKSPFPRGRSDPPGRSEKKDEKGKDGRTRGRSLTERTSERRSRSSSAPRRETLVDERKAEIRGRRCRSSSRPREQHDRASVEPRSEGSQKVDTSSRSSFKNKEMNAAPKSAAARRSRSLSRPRSEKQSKAAQQHQEQRQTKDRDFTKYVRIPQNVARTEQDERPQTSRRPRSVSLDPSARRSRTRSTERHNNVSSRSTLDRSAGPSRETSFRREGGIFERLFGDYVPAEARRKYLPDDDEPRPNQQPSPGVVSFGLLPRIYHTRTLLTASVYHSSATKLWITTINTNQRGITNKSNAAKYLKAFSFHNEREARESAYANAPPKIVPLGDNPKCFICNGKFAVFRRPSSCRNCGVCVCSTCSTLWSAMMLPETYNSKNEKRVRVCKSCNHLAGSFKNALIRGNYYDAVALYNTGNVNLRCPFKGPKGGETMFPIHCAVEGGNLNLLRWLVDVHFCPIRMIRTGNRHGDRSLTQPILTSKGRSVLSIAMMKRKVDILRYLAIEKSVSVYESSDLKTALGALEAVLLCLPPRTEVDLPPVVDPNKESRRSSVIVHHPRHEERRGGRIITDLPPHEMLNGANQDVGADEKERAPTPPIWHISMHGELNPSEDPVETDLTDDPHDDGTSVSTSLPDSCIICYERPIDCVITPCGHQVSCLECSTNLVTCPVCSTECQFIRIFRP